MPHVTVPHVAAQVCCDSSHLTELDADVTVALQGNADSAARATYTWLLKCNAVVLLQGGVYASCCHLLMRIAALMLHLLVKFDTVLITSLHCCQGMHVVCDTSHTSGTVSSM